MPDGRDLIVSVISRAQAPTPVTTATETRSSASRASFSIDVPAQPASRAPAGSQARARDEAQAAPQVKPPGVISTGAAARPSPSVRVTGTCTLIAGFCWISALCAMN